MMAIPGQYDMCLGMGGTSHQNHDFECYRVQDLRIIAEIGPCFFIYSSLICVSFLDTIFREK